MNKRIIPSVLTSATRLLNQRAGMYLWNTHLHQQTSASAAAVSESSQTQPYWANFRGILLDLLLSCTPWDTTNKYLPSVHVVFDYRLTKVLISGVKLALMYTPQRHEEAPS